jgi:L-threonylcarbamoyladenylate synthase
MSQVPAHRSAPRILHASDPAAIVEIGRLLREGSVVVLPTDTGYGIAASLFQTASVERVYTIKQRDTSLRIPVFIPTSADLPLVVREVPALAWKLIGKFWPGPLSLVLPAARAVPRPVTGGLGTVAVRLPGGNACLQVLEFLGEPVTGTSANISGRPGAGKAQEVVDQLGSTIDALLIDDSAAIYHKASTVVGLKDGTMTIHREGALSSDALRSASAARTTSQPPLIASRSRR